MPSINWKLLLGTGIALAVAQKIWQYSTMLPLQDKVVLITGGSRGLGLAMAEEFARQGAKLVLFARDEDELMRAAQKLGGYEEPPFCLLHAMLPMKRRCSVCLSRLLRQWDRLIFW